ncbi:MAG: UbiA family prenyltransferase [Planctomycetota bacterium]
MSSASSKAHEGSPVVAFGQLLRIALFPSAVSDVFVGVAIGHLALWPELVLPWLLIPASLGVYHGAMALNDWVDRADDARTRPERPIPSGAIPAPMALALAALLISGGLLWAFAAGPRAGVWMWVVALLAVLYDVVGRGPLRGPLLLGLCRAGNLGVGLLSPWLIGGAESPRLELLVLAALYGSHVFFVARLGRLEDDEDERALEARPSAALRGAAWTLLAVPIGGAFALGIERLTSGDLALPAGLVLSAALAGWSATGLLGRARTGAEEGWTRASVGAATGLCLRRLPIFAASIASLGLFLGPAAAVALLVALAGARLSGALRGLFPLT